MERVRSVFFTLTILFASTQLVSADVRAGQPVAEFSRFEENGKVGLKDEHGNVLIPAAYEAIGWSDGKLSIVDRVVGYRADGYWGIISTSNKIVTEPGFLELRPGEGSFLIAQKKSTLSHRPSFGVINTSGKTVIPFIYDALTLSNMRAVIMSRIGTRYLFGLTDLSHKIVIPVQYNEIRSLGSLRYAVENFDHKTAIFSEGGSQLTPFNIDSISSFRNNYSVIYQDQKQGVMSRSGELVVQPVYAEVQIADEVQILVREAHHWFLLEGNNRQIAEVRADALKPISANHYAVYNAGKVRLTGNDFKAMHDGFFSSLENFREGRALFRKDSRTGLIDTQGKILITPEYHHLEIDGNGFRAALETNGKLRWLILDERGNALTEKHYDFIAPFNGKFYPARRRGYWGALDAAGEEIISCVHDSLMEQSHDKVVVRFKGEYGVVDLKEHWRVTPQQEPIKLVNDEVYFEYDSNTTFLKSFRGDLIYFSDNVLSYDAGGYILEKLPSGSTWIVDMNGIVINRSNEPLLVDEVFPETEGLRAISKDGKFGFIDSEGRLRIANRYEGVQPFSDGLAAIRIRGKWGFIDRQEQLVIQPVYDVVEHFSNGVAIVSQGGQRGLIDRTGKLLLPIRYDEVMPNMHGRYILRSGKHYGLADASGSVIIHPKYNEITDTGNGYVIVQREGKYGVLTLNSVSTIPMVYDNLTFDPYRNHFVAMKKSEWQTLKKQ